MNPPIQAITGATVLVGYDLEPVPDATVVMAEGRIEAVSARSDTVVPEGAEVMDGAGKTLIPGFIDAHVHIGFYDPSEVLAGGVTTVRDLGWPPARIESLVDGSHRDGFDGPTIVAAGQMLTAPGGYPSRARWAPEGTAREITGLDDARVAVDEVAGAGRTIVKIALNPPVGPVLDAETLAAIVDAAHRSGLKVTGHVYGLEELHKALEAGVDELAHMLMSDEVIPAPTIERMVAAGVTIVPTLSVFSGPALQTAISNLRSFLDAGGRVVYGTDLGNEGPRPGIDRNEVLGMSEAGMSGADIIRSATVGAADWLSLGRTGVIAPGHAADLVLVNGDPLTDVTCLTDIHRVWKKGRARES